MFAATSTCVKVVGTFASPINTYRLAIGAARVGGGGSAARTIHGNVPNAVTLGRIPAMLPVLVVNCYQSKL